MTANKNRRARLVRRIVTNSHRRKRLETIADELVRLGSSTVQEMTYAKMASRADVKELRALVEQRMQG